MLELVIGQSTATLLSSWHSQTGLPFWLFVAIWAGLAVVVFPFYRGAKLTRLYWLRLLMLLIAVLVLANPAFLKDVYQKQLLVLAIDNSASSQLPSQSSGERSRLSAVQQYFENELSESDELWQQLEERYQIEVASIDASVNWPSDDSLPQHSLPQQFVSKLAGQVSRSRLAEGVQEIIENDPAAIVLFSDGATTSGENLASVSTNDSSDTAIHTVGLGATEAPANLKLTDLQLDRRVRAGSSFPVTVTLQADSLAQTTTSISVIDQETNEVLGQQSVSISSARFSRQVVLPVKLDQVGTVKMQVVAEQVTGETTAADNAQTATVQVVENGVRVLLVCDLPSPSYRFVKETLQRATDALSGQPLFELQVLLQQASPDLGKVDPTALRTFPREDELANFDVVIFGDAKINDAGTLGGSRELSNENLKALVRYVETESGNVVFLFGPEHASEIARSETLAPLLSLQGTPTSQVPPNQVSVLEFQPAAASFGAASLLLQEKEAIESLRFYPVLEFEQDGNGSISLLSLSPIGEPTTSQPALSLRKVGSGNVITQWFDNLYRVRTRRNDDLFSQYWARLVSDLAMQRLQARDRTAILLSDSLAYDVAAPIQLSAEVFDPTVLQDGEQTTSIRVRITNDRNLSQTIVLNRNGEQVTRLQYSTQLNGLIPGNYSARLEAAENATDGAVASIDFRVVDGLAESQVLTQQQSDLQKMAKANGGLYADLGGIQSLWQAVLNSQSRRLVSQQSVSLWSVPWIPTLFAVGTILLLALEWWFRRRWKLDP